jgi:hypothetical protein
LYDADEDWRAQDEDLEVDDVATSATDDDVEVDNVATTAQDGVADEDKE